MDSAREPLRWGALTRRSRLLCSDQHRLRRAARREQTHATPTIMRTSQHECSTGGSTHSTRRICMRMRVRPYCVIGVCSPTLATPAGDVQGASRPRRSETSCVCVCVCVWQSLESRLHSRTSRGASLSSTFICCSYGLWGLALACRLSRDEGRGTRARARGALAVARWRPWALCDGG